MNNPLIRKKTYRLTIRFRSSDSPEKRRVCNAVVRAGSREEACREVVHVQMSKGNVVQSIMTQSISDA